MVTSFPVALTVSLLAAFPARVRHAAPGEGGGAHPVKSGSPADTMRSERAKNAPADATTARRKMAKPVTPVPPVREKDHEVVPDQPWDTDFYVLNRTIVPLPGSERLFASL